MVRRRKFFTRGRIGKMDNLDGGRNDANGNDPSGSETKSSNIVQDHGKNNINKEASVNRSCSAQSYSIQIRDVALTKDDEERPYQTYDRHNYPTGAKDKGIMEEVPKYKNRVIDPETSNILLGMIVTYIKYLEFSGCSSWSYDTTLWAIRKQLLKEHIGSSLDATLATQDDDGRYIGRIWACHCIEPSNEKGRKAFTILVMRLWEQYKMKSFLQHYLRELETQYTRCKRLRTSPSESSSVDEDESSSADEDDEDVELDEL